MNHRARVAGRLAISLGLVGLVTAAYSLAVHVNPTTIALTYVVVILLIATWWGIAESTTASVAAVLCFNFFFLPPVGTLTIADPENWVALVAFLLTAIITSQLSGRARRRHVDALMRQRDLERLYVLSRALLLSERGTSLPGQIARHIADAFELPVVGIYDQRTDAVAWAGARDWPEIDAKLRELARHGGSARDRSAFIIIAIQLGGVPIGSVAVADVGLSDTVLHSIANLAAIGLERARANEAAARADAARESSELRATVLDALAHDFKTPLTSMKAASSNLLASPAANPGTDRELIAIIDEDVDRLSALVTDAVQMLRIDAGDFVVHLERLELGAVVEGALQRFRRQLDGHDLVTRVPAGLSVEADRDLLALALRQLLDNALKYSPATSAIQIEAKGNGVVDITVRNSGSTIPHGEQARVVERFYRGAQARKIPGTGMGLAIVRQIAGAHQGTLTLVSSADAGTSFTLSLPRGGPTS
jgi:two-component system sensor histidine kinase KdpD